MGWSPKNQTDILETVIAFGQRKIFDFVHLPNSLWLVSAGYITFEQTKPLKAKLKENVSTFLQIEK